MLKNTFLYLFLFVSSSVFAVPDLYPQMDFKESPEYAPFGINIGKQYKDYIYNTDLHNKIIEVEAEKPTKKLFQKYGIILSPNSKVYSVTATGYFGNHLNDCYGIMHFLQSRLDAAYPETDGFHTSRDTGKSLVLKRETYNSTSQSIVRENTKYIVYLSCIGGHLEFNFRSLAEYPDVIKIYPNHLKDIEINF